MQFPLSSNSQHLPVHERGGGGVHVGPVSPTVCSRCNRSHRSARPHDNSLPSRCREWGRKRYKGTLPPILTSAEIDPGTIPCVKDTA